MKLSPNLINEVKSRVDLIEVVGQYVHLKRQGSERYVGLCPFHSENTPSFGVNSRLQYYKCFGCGAGGDVFAFIQSIQRISFSQAVVLLTEQYGIAVAPQHVIADEHPRFHSRTVAFADLFKIGLVWHIERELEQAKALLFESVLSSIDLSSERVSQLTRILHQVQNWTAYEATETYLDLQESDPTFVRERVDEAMEFQIVLASILWSAATEEGAR